MPGRARRLPRRPSETAGALNLKEHRGRRLLTPAAAPFLKARRRAGVKAGFEICACGLGMRGAARRVNGMQGWFGRLPGRKISEGAALRGFAGFQKADEFGEETHLKGRPSSRRFRLAFHSAQKWKTPLPQA